MEHEKHHYLTVQEVARRLRVDPRRVREAIARKELRAHRVGKGARGEYRIPWADFQDWLKQTETKPSDKGDLVEV